MPVTHVPKTVQIFVVVVSAATAVATTIQKLIVVVSAATAVATIVQKFIVVVTAVTGDNYDCTEIYRRSQRGYRCSYDSYRNLS